MERLDPELERLLQKARAGEDPTSQDRDRNLDALARRVGGAALVGAAVMTTSEIASGVAGATQGAAVAAKAGVPTALALVLKVGAPLVLIGAVGAIALPRIMARPATSAREVAPSASALAHDDPTKTSGGAGRGDAPRRAIGVSGAFAGREACVAGAHPGCSAVGGSCAGSFRGSCALAAGRACSQRRQARASAVGALGARAPISEGRASRRTNCGANCRALRASSASRSAARRGRVSPAVAELSARGPSARELRGAGR